MTTFTITPDGPFSLESASTFGFGPNSGRPTYEGARMKLAFATDDFQNHAYVSLNQAAPARAGSGDVTGTIESDADTDAVVSQVRRILSLNASGSDWLAVGETDPVLGRMQREHPGLRPVSFHSPYEAAAWSVISARRQRAQGAVVRNRIAEQLGRVYGDGSDRMFAFPTPHRLLELDYVQGREAVKVERLHAVARAALDGELDAERLLAVPTEEALERLLKLPGIGPMYGTLILLRGTGSVDAMTGVEPRLPTYLGHLYGLDGEATPAQIETIMEGWRPFRTWSSVLTRVSGDALGLPLPARPDSGRRPGR
jgi:DNA-3-methyladenine glycosylase II